MILEVFVCFLIYLFMLVTWVFFSCSVGMSSPYDLELWPLSSLKCTYSHSVTPEAKRNCTLFELT